MFFQIFEKKLTGNLDDENIIFERYRLDRLEPGLVMLPFNNILDDL
jgi:hypothetical protein